MIEGQPSTHNLELDAAIYERSTLESRLMELEGNYNKRFDAQINALKRRIQDTNTRIHNSEMLKKDMNKAA